MKTQAKGQLSRHCVSFLEKWSRLCLYLATRLGTNKGNDAQRHGNSNIFAHKKDGTYREGKIIGRTRMTKTKALLYVILFLLLLLLLVDGCVENFSIPWAICDYFYPDLTTVSYQIQPKSLILGGNRTPYF